MQPADLLSNPLVVLLLAQLIAGVFGWVISWFTSEAEHRAEQDSPFFAGLMTFLRGVGIDVPKVLAGLRDMVLAMVNRHPAQVAARSLAARRRGEQGFATVTALAWAGLVAVVAGLALCASCAAVKPAVCPLIKLVDEACPYVMVAFPDGHQEAFLREDVVKGARAAADARAAKSGAGGSKPAGQ